MVVNEIIAVTPKGVRHMYEVLSIIPSSLLSWIIYESDVDGGDNFLVLIIVSTIAVTFYQMGHAIGDYREFHLQRKLDD